MEKFIYTLFLSDKLKFLNLIVGKFRDKNLNRK